MDPIPFEKTTVKEAKAVLDSVELAWVEKPAATHSKSWEKKRSPRLPEDLKLSQRAIEWLTTLPREVRPLRLAVKFPHVVNKLSEVWGRAAAAEDYLNGLLIIDRKDREGFPIHIVRELHRVKQHKQDEFDAARAKRLDEAFKAELD